MIGDAISVAEYYTREFNADPPSLYIPNGTVIDAVETSEVSLEQANEILAGYGVEPHRFVLFLSRHEPDNSCEYVLEAFQGLEADAKLLFGGTAAYPGDYQRSLRRFDDPRILFPGGIYDPLHVKVLHHYCSFVIQGNRPGGTSLGLLRALGFGTPVLAFDTPDNAFAVDDPESLWRERR